jgi:hypothetical protein
MAGKKIGELTPLGRNLIATDELELSLAGSAGSRKITGQEIIDAVGGVTSVDMTTPTGLTVTGNPITGAGTLALGLQSGYSIPTTANQSNWTTAYNDSITSANLSYGGASTNLVLNQQDSGTISASLIAGAASVGKFVFYNGTNLAYVSLNATTPLSYDNGLNTFSISQSGASTNGFLSSTDWNTFNNKQAAITLTTTGSSGDATLVGSTLNIPNYSSALSGYVPTGRQLTINGTAYDLSADRSWSVGTVTSVATTGPITGGTITGSGTIGITQATNSADGYLSSTDWNTFNNKQAALVSGTNIKTINFLSLLGSGDISLVAGLSGTSPISASVGVGGSGNISISQSGASTDGYLSSADWNTFNSKQAALVSGTNIKTINSTSLLGSGDVAVQPTLVSGTNIKTINGSSVLGSGDLVVGGGGGIHALIKPQSGMGVSAALNTDFTTGGGANNEMIFYPFIPAQSFTSTNLSLWVTYNAVGATFRALIYSDLNGLPNTKLFESATIDGSTSGLKTITNTFNFVAGTTYWLCYHSGVSGAGLVSIASNSIYSFAAKKASGYNSFVSSYYLNFALGSAPTTATIIQSQTYYQFALPNININV